MRSKRWWNDEIAELRKVLGKARRADRSHRTGATKADRRDPRRAIRAAKKACWNGFLENARGEDEWTAVRYIHPKPDDSARPLISGGDTAITRDDKEWMILAAAFPEPPPDNGITAPQGGSAYPAIDQPLVGRILAGCSNRSAPGEGRMGAEIVTLLLQWDPSGACDTSLASVHKVPAATIIPHRPSSPAGTSFSYPNIEVSYQQSPHP